MKKQTKINYSLLAIILALLLFGLAALYSASTVDSYQKFGTTTYYIIHQFVYGALLGIVAMYIASKIDYHFWQKNLPWLILISLGLLFIVKLSSYSFSSGGATRWLRLGPVVFQPAELAKLVIIFYLASWIDKKRHKLNDFYFGLLPSFVIIALFSLLILWQPDLGTMFVLVGIAVALLFVGGINWRYLFWTVAAGILGLYALVKLEPYRMKRLTTFFNRSVDPQGISYQINQALLAIGSGGLWGYGYGLSRQKYNYLPEVMTDSIFAVIAEELGFVRIIFIIILFALFALKGFQIAKGAPDMFGKLTAFGIVSWITLQAIINISAMVHLIPLTGIPLPFFSYGSSALVLNLAAIGILMNISRQSA
ncbi:MAG: putative lipid II flippase FtsW [Patescibacteria group bacterium]|nr:putative lipid II flippase FtsW [Patescibacteria group bacterium]